MGIYVDLSSDSVNHFHLSSRFSNVAFYPNNEEVIRHIMEKCFDRLSLLCYNEITLSERRVLNVHLGSKLPTRKNPVIMLTNTNINCVKASVCVQRDRDTSAHFQNPYDIG